MLEFHFRGLRRFSSGTVVSNQPFHNTHPVLGVYRENTSQLSDKEAIFVSRTAGEVQLRHTTGIELP